MICHVTIVICLFLVNMRKRKEKKRKRKREIKRYQKNVGFKLCSSDIIHPSKFLLLEEPLSSPPIFLSLFFHLFQFLSNLSKYLFSNFLLFYLYNIFTIYFPGNPPLLKFFSSTIPNFSCILTSVFILPLNSATTFFMFSKSSSFSQLLCSAVNSFHCTRYFTTPLTFLLFNIISTFYSLTLSTSTGFTSSFFCPPTWFLYCTTQLTFTTE